MTKLHFKTEIQTSSKADSDLPLPKEFYGSDTALMNDYESKVATLREYIVVAENPEDLRDEHQRRVVFSKLSYGLRKSGEFLGWALRQSRMAEVRRKEAEAIAAMDEFPDFVERRKAEGKDIKGTDAVMKYYVNTSPGVIKASETEALWMAIVQQISTMKAEFMMAISTIKAMAYGVKDSDIMTGNSSAANGNE